MQTPPRFPWVLASRERSFSFTHISVGHSTARYSGNNHGAGVATEDTGWCGLPYRCARLLFLVSAKSSTITSAKTICLRFQDQPRLRNIVIQRWLWFQRQSNTYKDATKNISIKLISMSATTQYLELLMNRIVLHFA